MDMSPGEGDSHKGLMHRGRKCITDVFVVAGAVGGVDIVQRGTPSVSILAFDAIGPQADARQVAVSVVRQQSFHCFSSDLSQQRLNKSIEEHGIRFSSHRSQNVKCAGDKTSA